MLFGIKIYAQEKTDLFYRNNLLLYNVMMFIFSRCIFEISEKKKFFFFSNIASEIILAWPQNLPTSKNGLDNVLSEELSPRRFLSN